MPSLQAPAQVASAPFAPPTEHHLLVFWIQLLVLLMTARALGRLARRFGQPAVIGELTAGILLGPSLLGAVWPGGFEWLFPTDGESTAMLFTVGWLGVTLLLLVTGYETDLGLIRSLGRAAVAVSTASLVVPFAAGIAIGYAMPDAFQGPDSTPVVFALFMGTALAISSLPVIAKVLTELDLMRRNFGQITLAAGMANDLVGWMALGLVAGIARSGRFELGELVVAVVGMAVLLTVAFTVGQRMVEGLLRRVRAGGAGPTAELSTTVAVAVLAGVLMQMIGVEAVLGAFVAGIVLGRSRVDQTEVRGHLEALTFGILAPVFFATAGLRVDLALIGTAEGMLWAGAIVGVASLAKFAGAALGARLAGLSSREGAALGVGLNARGALEIVIATVGLGLGVLSDASYAAVVVMAVVTSVMAPPLLRLVVRDWRGSPEEQERLDHEARLRSNILVGPSRILIPSRGGPNSLAAVHLVNAAWPDGVEATVLSAGNGAAQEAARRALRAFGGRPAEHQHVDDPDAINALTREALLGYGAVVVGADRSGPGAAISPLVDQILLSSPIPVVAVRRALEGDPLPGSFRRILIAVTGTRVSRAAQEVGFGVAARQRAEAALVHIVTTAPAPVLSLAGAARKRIRAGGGSASSGGDQPHLAGSFVAEAAQMGTQMGVAVDQIVREAPSAGEGIVTVATEVGADLVVIGATVRSTEGRPFLGRNVELVLDEAPMTVAAVALPAEERPPPGN